MKCTHVIDVFLW